MSNKKQYINPAGNCIQKLSAGFDGTASNRWSRFKIHKIIKACQGNRLMEPIGQGKLSK